MSGCRRGLGAMVVLAIVAGCGGEPTATVTSLTVTGAWARSTPPGAVNGVVYLTVASPSDDVLVGVSVPASVAAAAAMHETMGGGGASPMPNMPDMTTPGSEMTMTPLDSVELPAGTAVVFEPGGKHIMLTGLTGPLLAGAHLPLTLTFASGTTLTVDVVVAVSAPES